MSDGYNYSPLHGREASENMAAVFKHLDTSLAELNGAVNTFLSSNQGEGVNEFVPAQNKWNEGHREMTAHMGVASNRMDDIHHSYLLNDNVAANRFAS